MPSYYAALPWSKSYGSSRALWARKGELQQSWQHSGNAALEGSRRDEYSSSIGRGGDWYIGWGGDGGEYIGCGGGGDGGEYAGTGRWSSATSRRGGEWPRSAASRKLTCSLPTRKLAHRTLISPRVNGKPRRFMRKVIATGIKQSGEKSHCFVYTDQLMQGSNVSRAMVENGGKILGSHIWGISTERKYKALHTKTNCDSAETSLRWFNTNRTDQADQLRRSVRVVVDWSLRVLVPSSFVRRTAEGPPTGEREGHNLVGRARRKGEGDKEGRNAHIGRTTVVALPKGGGGRWRPFSVPSYVITISSGGSENGRKKSKEGSPSRRAQEV